MKKFLVYFLYLGLCGCYVPNFHESKQEIQILHTPGINFKVDGQLQQEEHLNTVQKLTVNRSFKDLKIVLEKEGFESKQITLSSHLTDDKWALELLDLDHPNKSGWYLMPPIETASLTGLGFWKGFTGPYSFAQENGGAAWALVPLTPVTTVAGTLAGFGVGIIVDIFNTVFGIPAVIITNPWYEYNNEIDLSKVLLTPTPEFKQKCHSEKNKFIGNHECLSCQINRDIFASKTECAYCPNREWNQGLCRLKCSINSLRTKWGECRSCQTDSPFYDVSPYECHQCSNREWQTNGCYLKK